MERELEGSRSAHLDRVHSVQLRVSVHGEMGTPEVSVVPDLASESVKK